MNIETIATWIFRGIVLLIGGGILWFLFILLPYRIVIGAIQVLIGRPFGFGWIPVSAEMLPEEGSSPPAEQKAEADYKYAVYTVDGRQYRMPYFRKVKADHLKLYVKKKTPRVIWTHSCDNRQTALAGLLMILSLWAGLAMTAIYFVQMMRS